MQLFYTPQHARVGDVIPYYEDGKFHLFYLKNWNPYFGSDRKDGWHLLNTKDMVHYGPETAIGILGGTGSVIKADGIYHLYYCVFEQNPQRQYVCHATSSDLDSWTKHEEETFGPDETIYLPTDWRDPYVFWNEEENCWWMLLCAQSQGKTGRRGCVGLCKSADLHHWECCEPYPGDFSHVDTRGTAMIDVAKGRNIGIMKFICKFDAPTTHFYDLQDIPISANVEPDPF